MSTAKDDTTKGSNGTALPTAAPGSSISGAVPVKKIISCVQCRKRKLKCDRAKPSCGTCSRLQHSCVYPEGRMKSNTKRRNVKDLEARLAQVETLLKSETSSKLSANYALMGNLNPDLVSGTGVDLDWDDLDMDLGLGDESTRTTNPAAAIPVLPHTLVDETFANELIGFGMQEQLPSQEIIDRLHQIFFDRIYRTTPVMNKYRYLSNVNLPPGLGPPLCLRYAIWAVSAAASDQYSTHQEVFYQRARRYAEADEMRGQGGQFVTICHAQAWSLISNYEAQNMYLSRAWVSAGKCIRMAQMMNLHRVDTDADDVKHIIGQPRDWMEMEERRRTFWAAFCCDRYSCAGTGWPMSIDERDILTNLPSSEEAFEQGRMEPGLTLTEAMTGDGATRISPYAGVVLMACLFGHNWIHLHRPNPNDHPEDLNGEFWKRHRKMDNILSNTAMFFPEHLKLPAGIRDPNIVTLNMNIHSSVICLHQAALNKAEKHRLDPAISKQSAARCRLAAEEIVSIMRLISHFDLTEMDPWMSFNLYVATGVLIEGCKTPGTAGPSRSNLDFLVTAMQAMGRKHTITKSFLFQLKNDLQAAGLDTILNRPSPNGMDFDNGMTWGPSSIWRGKSASGVNELAEKVNSQSVWAGDGPSPISGSSGASTMGTTTPPIDMSCCFSMNGVLPRTSLDMRFRRVRDEQGHTDIDLSRESTSREGDVQQRQESSRGSGPKPSSSVPQFGLRQVRISDNPADPMAPSIDDITSQNSASHYDLNNASRVTPLANFQQWGNAADQKSLNAANFQVPKESVTPDWVLQTLDQSLPNGFTGYEYSIQDAQMDAVLNEAPWDEEIFGGR